MSKSIVQAVRKVAVLASALAAASLMAVSMTAPASAAVGTNSVWNFGLWYLSGVGTKCIDSANGNPGTYVTTWGCNRGDHQDWAPSLDYSDGSVAFRNKYFNKCMMAEFSPATKIEVYTCTGGTLQRWYPHLIGGSTYTYKNVARGLCLDVSGTANGAPLLLKTCSGSYYQEWVINYNGG